MKLKITLALFLITSLTFGQRTLIHCGNLIDGKSNDAQSQMTIVVEGNKIISVEKGLAKPGGTDKLIDLSKKTVMPGLIDMHVHLEGETSKDQALQRFTLNKADLAFGSTVYAKRTLMAGFTTVRDLGGSGVNVSLRNAVNQGLVVGPRILTAGKSVASTGGHADPTNGYREDLMGDPGPKEGVINSPEEARQAVRQRYKDGADLIKITATGGVLSIAKDGSGPQFTNDELKAIIDLGKVGVRLNPSLNGFLGMKVDEETISTFDYIVTRLNNYNLAYLHLSEPFTDVTGNQNAIQEVAKHYRPIYKGTIIINRGFTKDAATKVLNDGHADLVSFGVPYIANPDLVERFKADAHISSPDQATFYTPGEKGYTDYPLSA